MGDLAKYIAEVIEFIVGGVLVLFALLLLAVVLAHPDMDAVSDRTAFLTSNALTPVFGIAVIYALGILAEGLSRAIFERGLAKLTVKELQGRGDKGTERAFATSPADLQRRQLDYYPKLREEWRMEVVALSPPLAAQIEGQLKRLRVERAAALSGLIATLALVIDVGRHGGEDGLAVRLMALVAIGLVTCCAVWLSRVRLSRFLGTIVRCHETLERAGVGPQ